MAAIGPDAVAMAPPSPSFSVSPSIAEPTHKLETISGSFCYDLSLHNIRTFQGSRGGQNARQLPAPLGQGFHEPRLYQDGGALLLPKVRLLRCPRSQGRGHRRVRSGV